MFKHGKLSYGNKMKTLTLSIILQVSLFPQYGIVLGYCVLHHIIHMMMDGYLAGWLARRPGYENRL
jgi:sodium/bile acid cotransporter 7